MSANRVFVEAHGGNSDGIGALSDLPIAHVAHPLPLESPGRRGKELPQSTRRAGKVTVVSVDGGCTGVRNVKAGIIAATSQQYPLKMASRGVQAVVTYAKTGKKVSGYTDTGVNLITAKPVAGVPSKGLAFGLANCWG